MRIRLVALLLLLATAAHAQTTVTRTDRLVIANPPAKSSETACLWRDSTTGMVATGACPTGTVSSVGLSLPGIFSVSGSPVTTSGTLTASLVSQTQNLVWASPNGSSGAPTFRALADADVPDNLTLGTVSGNPAFSGYIASSLLPNTTDTYDLGSGARLWNQAFISQLNAVVFAEATTTLFGGYSIIGYNAGALAADVSSAATTVNFGKAMTVGHWVVIRAHDTGGTVKAEYLLVGSLVSGTTYNVTRDLAGAHGTDPAWASGTPFLVLGADGTGRVELSAYSTPTGTSPGARVSIITQGATYGALTERVRLGILDGMPGMASGKYGIYIGDTTGTQGLSYYDGALTVKGTVTATAGAIGGWTLGATSLTGGGVTLSSTGSVSGGSTTLDSTGLSVAVGTGTSWTAANAYRFTSASSNLKMGLGSIYDSAFGAGTKRALLIEHADSGGSAPALQSIILHVGPTDYYNVSGPDTGSNAIELSRGVSGQDFVRLYSKTGTILLDAGNVTLTSSLLTVPAAVASTSSSSPGSLLKASATSASNGTLHYLLRLDAGSDGTLGPLYFIAGLYPSATGSSRYVQLFAGDYVAFRPIVFNDKVGIGVAPPSYALDVNGDINATGYRAGGTQGMSATFNPTGCTSLTFTNGLLTGKSGC